MLRKLGFFTGLWWVALRERDAWLKEWIERRSARVELFAYRTGAFIGVAAVLALSLHLSGGSRALPKLFVVACLFGAVTLWLRSGTWIGEYREVFASRSE